MTERPSEDPQSFFKLPDTMGRAIPRCRLGHLAVPVLQPRHHPVSDLASHLHAEGGGGAAERSRCAEVMLPYCDETSEDRGSASSESRLCIALRPRLHRRRAVHSREVSRANRNPTSPPKLISLAPALRSVYESHFARVEVKVLVRSWHGFCNYLGRRAQAAAI
jgi:hypothetical protein